MFTIAFWLAVATFFIPKKYKKLCFLIVVGIIGVDFLYVLIQNIFRFHLSWVSLIFNFGYQINPLRYIFRPIINLIYSKGLYNFPFILIAIFEDIIILGIAFVATKVSVIKYEADKEFDSYTETSSDEVTSTNDGKLLRVVEVNAGLCTGTLRGAALEARINQIASQGWKFEQFETIIGRCCLFFPRYKAIICFSKEN